MTVYTKQSKRTGRHILYDDEKKIIQIRECETHSPILEVYVEDLFDISDTFEHLIKSQFNYKKIKN